jgi:hypothetical protein
MFDLANIPAATVEGKYQKSIQANIVEILFRASAWRKDILDYMAQRLSLTDVSTEIRNHFLELLVYE